ncbi:TIP41-like family-domain-containing protein [Blastocladiella britannica]|nr:TIP41-like family-domain-containing protein [Blastocladiella britannica]
MSSAPPKDLAYNHHGWEFLSRTAPISNAQDLDATLEWLADRAAPNPALHAMPEMYFGTNMLTVSQPASGFVLEFSAKQALAEVEVGPDSVRWKEVKVAAAGIWSRRLEQRRAARALSHSDSALGSIAPTDDDQAAFGVHPDDITTTPKPFDWTYSTSYRGTVRGLTPAPTSAEIPMAKLRQREPILFYADNVLYEDELGDNGIAKYSVKIRAMPSGFFILARLFLRVDGVMFRTIDTRIYHEYGTLDVLREHSMHTVPFAAVRVRAVMDVARDRATGVLPMLGPGATIAARPRPPSASSRFGTTTATSVPTRNNGNDDSEVPDPDVAARIVDEGWAGMVLGELAAAAAATNSDSSEVLRDMIVLTAKDS